MGAPRWLRLSAALACATAWSGFREAAALRAEGHESTGVLPAVTKRDLTAPRASSLQQQRVQQEASQEQEAGATSSSAGIDGKSSWKKSLAAGAAVGALATGGGVEAFHVHPHAEAAGVRGKAALDNWASSAQFPGGGAVFDILEEQPLYMSDQAQMEQLRRDWHEEQAARGGRALRPNAADIGERQQFLGGGTVIGDFKPSPFSIFPNQALGRQTSVAEQRMMEVQQRNWHEDQRRDWREDQYDAQQTRVRIGPKLGNGAYADVFVGTYYPEDSPENRINVAVKKLLRTVETERESKREMRMMLEMDMDNNDIDDNWPFLKFYGFEEHADGRDFWLWAIMELADGHVESMVMKKNLEEFSFLDRMSVIIQLTRAVSIMNKKGLIHRDVKPNNIFLKQVTNDDGRREYMVKLGDFGLACAITGDIDVLCLSDMERKEFSNIGVPLYMSRERFSSQFGEMLKPGSMPQAMKCDVFSIGMVLYQLMFLGRAPLAFFKHHGPPTEEQPSGQFDGIAWANDFDLQKDPVFRHAVALTEDTESEEDDENVVIYEVLKLMEAMLTQDVNARPFAVEVYNEGFERIALAIEAAEGYLGGGKELNKRVAQRIGDILESASTDPEVERMMGKPL